MQTRRWPANAGSRLKLDAVLGRPRLKGQPSSRTGENSPYGMIGGIEETSASFEARSASRSYPTCWLCRFMALSWRNLPCALKVAIGIGKRTLGHPASLPRQGPQQGPIVDRGSLRLDPKLLDDRPPFLGIGFPKGIERFRALALARIDRKAEIGQPRAHPLICQRFHCRRIELADDLLRHVLGREHCHPSRAGKRGQPHLAECRSIRRLHQSRITGHGVSFDVPCARERKLNR